MRTELHTIARHAGTVFVGQLAVMAFSVTDTVVAGRYAATSLAALSVGSAVYITIFVALLGVLQAQLPIWSELRGAGKHHELGRSVRQALYLTALTSAVGVACLLSPGPLLRWTEVPPALEGEVRRYLALLAVSLPFALLFRVYSTLNQSLGRPLLVTWIQIGSLGLKVPLSIWFAFGGLGLPALGLVGCALATVVVNGVMAGLALWMVRTQDLYTPYQLWHRLERPHGPTLRGFARLGIPTGLSIMVEVTSFTLMALFIARLGTEAAASHQVAANMAALLYMMPLALGIATSARVSYWLGAKDPARARLALRLGFRITVGLSLASGTLVTALHGTVARLYVGDNPAVVALAASLLPWVAAYHVADAVQAVCVFVLRCYGIATATLVVYCLILWGVGLAGGYVLAFQGVAGLAALQTPAAFWGAGALALALTSVAFTTMLLRVQRARG